MDYDLNNIANALSDEEISVIKILATSTRENTWFGATGDAALAVNRSLCDKGVSVESDGRFHLTETGKLVATELKIPLLP